MTEWIRIVSGALLGYLIGSISPAYLLGRFVFGVDIRTVNYRNAGTRNVKKTLGLWPAAVTAAVDTSKGAAAMVLTSLLLGVDGYGLMAPAAASVVGHIFPFYLGFRGGRGVATAVGIFIYLTVKGILLGQFPYAVFIAVLVGAGLVYLASRSGDATALFAFLAMTIVSAVELGFSPPGAIASCVSLYALVHAFFRGRELGLYVLPQPSDVLGWRAIARPFALLFLRRAILRPAV